MPKKIKDPVKLQTKSFKNLLLEQHDLYISSANTVVGFDQYKKQLEKFASTHCFYLFKPQTDLKCKKRHLETIFELEKNTFSFEFVYLLLSSFYTRSSQIIKCGYTEIDVDEYIDVLQFTLNYTKELSSDKDKISMGYLILNQILPKNNEIVKDLVLKIALASDIWGLNLDNLRHIKYDNTDSGIVNRWYYYNLLKELKRDVTTDYVTSYLDDMFNGEDDSYYSKIFLVYNLQFVTQRFSVKEVRMTSKLYIYKELGSYDCIHNQILYGPLNIKRKVLLKKFSILETLGYTSLSTSRTLVDSDFTFTEGHVITGLPIFTKDYDSLCIFSGVIPKKKSLEPKWVESIPVILPDDKNTRFLGDEFSCRGWEIKIDNPLFLPKPLHSYLPHMLKYNVPYTGSIFIPTYMYNKIESDLILPFV